MKKAGDLISSYFNKVQEIQGESYINFNKSWKKIAGEKIGNNTTIYDVHDGNLIIEIDHPGWKQLILMKEKIIIAKIKKDYPELDIKKIKFHFKNKTKIRSENVEKEKNEKKDNYIHKTFDNPDFFDLLKKMSKRSEE